MTVAKTTIPGAQQGVTPHGYGPSTPDAQGANNAELRKACKRFEGMFLAYLFRVMRESIPRSGLLGSGMWQGMFDVFFDQAIGEKAAERSQLGIAKALEKQLSRSTQSVESEVAQGTQATSFGPLPAREGAPAWHRVKSLTELDDIVNVAAKAQGIDPDLVRAVIDVESGWNPHAVSPKGALGLMQLMPDTARELGVDDPLDPQENISGGARYLRHLLDAFDGDLVLALAAYNAGPGAVRRHGGVPPFAETHQYVDKVLSRYQSLKRLTQAIRTEPQRDG